MTIFILREVLQISRGMTICRDEEKKRKETEEGYRM
jgi:hypothetical protein